MALPPRFPGILSTYGAMPLPQMTPLMSFPNPYFMPNPLMAAAAVNSQRMQAAPVHQPKPPEKPPVTTVFVGNITEKCGNELIRSILSECGTVSTWKRIQGSNGKFQAFGFCEFDSPFGTMRALRILHDYQLAEKKLVVKIDDKTRGMVKDYVARKRQEKGLSTETLAADEMPADEENAADDELCREKIRTLIESDAPALLPCEEGELAEKARSPVVEKRRTVERERSERVEERRKERKEEEKYQAASRHRHRSRSRSASHDRHRSSRKRSRSASERSATKRVRHHSSSSRSASSRSSSSSSSDSSFTQGSGSRSGKAFRSRTPSRDRESEDSDEQRERRALRKQIREKENAYAERLRKWEAREKRQAKLYEKDEQREKQRRRDILKEAKKLKHFLEDYDDERMDPKYYKSSSLFQRRRDFEREREADTKDRQREQQEIDELKKQILAENQDVEDADEEARRRHQEQVVLKPHDSVSEDALLRKLRADSGSPNPHRPLGQKPLPVQPEKEEEEESEESESESESEQSREETELSAAAVNTKPSSWKAIAAEDTPVGLNTPSPSGISPSIRSSSVASPTMLRTSDSGSNARPSAASRLNGVFGFEDNEDDGTYRRGRKLKPFEITMEERVQTMTPEERKKMIKELIDRIPTTKNELFAFPINWDYVDKSLVEQRVKPWVTKKITDYIGEEEASLVDFVCEKVTSRTDPQKILSDIAMVLDDEADVFVVKMWRLLIYESEAKKLGLSKK